MRPVLVKLSPHVLRDSNLGCLGSPSNSACPKLNSRVSPTTWFPLGFPAVSPVVLTRSKVPPLSLSPYPASPSPRGAPQQPWKWLSSLSVHTALFLLGLLDLPPCCSPELTPDALPDPASSASRGELSHRPIWSHSLAGGIWFLRTWGHTLTSGEVVRTRQPLLPPRFQAQSSGSTAYRDTASRTLSHSFISSQVVAGVSQALFPELGLHGRRGVTAGRKAQPRACWEPRPVPGAPCHQLP